ncbi:hypothetical protein BDK51DRAFT_47194 [Blyttiomyces helicus]|uniref:Uncharacterized protein n=1 Tax=Blyttiomyces helicus TaxID=388810 RepID=A0A4P9VW31_9FUNG|nr:hypothetical protein BDK51DRAFT_47194 [Blyttiomyces helicus]|eukprot:RKO83055.1 hypothetical protein BDK51DRAFT_47194 [Blyttiomyces helicus]
MRCAASPIAIREWSGLRPPEPGELLHNLGDAESGHQIVQAPQLTTDARASSRVASRDASVWVVWLSVPGDNHEVRPLDSPSTESILTSLSNPGPLMDFSPDNSWICTQSSGTAAVTPLCTLPRTGNPSEFSSVNVTIPPDSASDSAPALPTLRDSLREAFHYQARSFALSMIIAALITALICAASRIDWRSRDVRVPHLVDQTKYTLLCAFATVLCLQTYTALLSYCVRGKAGNVTLRTAIVWNFLVVGFYALILQHGIILSMEPLSLSPTAAGRFLPAGRYLERRRQ